MHLKIPSTRLFNQPIVQAIVQKIAFGILHTSETLQHTNVMMRIALRRNPSISHLTPCFTTNISVLWTPRGIQSFRLEVCWYFAYNTTYTISFIIISCLDILLCERLIYVKKGILMLRDFNKMHPRLVRLGQGCHQPSNIHGFLELPIKKGWGIFLLIMAYTVCLMPPFFLTLYMEN